MARYHLIRNGVVENTVVWDGTPPEGTYTGFTVIPATEGEIGWTWDGSELSEPTPPPAPVPAEITRLQLLLGLKQSGFITSEEALAAAQGIGVPAAIDDIFNGLSEAAELTARITFATMTRVLRYDALLGIVQWNADLTDAEMDDLFRTWSTL